MYWTLELASYLSDAPWPATRDELIDYAIRTGAPLEVVENLQAIEEEEEETYEGIEDSTESKNPSLFVSSRPSSTTVTEKSSSMKFPLGSVARTVIGRDDTVSLSKETKDFRVPLDSTSKIPSLVG